MCRTASITAGLVVVLLSVAISGCASTSHAPASQPYCWPNAKCAKVKAVVEQCGGLSPGRCRIVPVHSIGLLRPDGRQVIAEYAAAGHKRDSFLLMTPTPGRYLIGATVDGQRIKHSITLRLGHTVRAKLITQIR